MLQAMREKMALVMWLTIIAFLGTIIFSWGMGGKFGNDDPRRENLLAVINGEKVYYDEFKNIIEQNSQNNKEANSDEVRSAELREQAWQQLVQSVLLRQQIKANDVTVSAEQIYYELKNNPLPDFQNHPDFMTNGVFSLEKYQQFIANPKPELKSLYLQLEGYYTNMLPMKILRDKVTQAAYVSDGEIMDEYSKMYIKANAKFIQAPASEFQPADATINPAEIEKYYSSHIDEMPLKKEQRSFDYVLFSFEPTIKDTNMVLDEISEALKQIYNNVPFEDVAKSYSEDGSAENGGDLGYFKQGQMVPEFEKAAFGAEIGTVVGPVKTQFGFHLIKVTDKKIEKDVVTEVKASHILIKFKAYNSTKDDAKFAAQQFKNMLDETKFDEAAKKSTKEIKNAEPAFKGDYAQEIGQVPGLGKFLFEGKKGDISPTLTCTKGYVFARIKDIDPERKRNKDELKDMIVAKIKNEKGIEAAYLALKNLEPQIADTASFTKIATANKMKTGYTGEMSKDGYVPGIGKDDIFGKIAFTTAVGKYSDIFKGTNSAYRLFVISRNEFDKATYESQKVSIKERLQIQQQNSIWSSWISGLEKKAEIKDYRSLYYN